MMLGLSNILIYVMIILEKMLRMSKAKNGVYTVPNTTPRMEHYMELNYNLIQSKGYARVTDIAEALEVQPSSVTKMVQKLDKDSYVHYEKYRGFVLTDKGNKVGQRLVFRHELLEDFLEISGLDEDKIYDDVEGIEHHLSWNAIDRIANVVEFFNEDKERIQRLNEIQIENEKEEV